MAREPDWKDRVSKWARWLAFQMEPVNRRFALPDACAECNERFGTWRIDYGKNMTTGVICRQCMKRMRSDLPDVEVVSQIAYWHAAP